MTQTSPQTSLKFSSLALNDALLENLDSLNYKEMTPIQAQSLPHILQGVDVIGQGKTGSGKTAAFSLGLLSKLDPKLFKLQSLVLCPTRELAEQVAKEIRTLARTMPNIKVVTLCGGSPLAAQRKSLENGAHIAVGTPGRVEDHLGKGTLDLSRVDSFVLDEADRMLEMGFQTALYAVFEHMPRARQTLLFSATFPEQIKAIANDIMSEPVSIKVTSTHDGNVIEQHFYQVDGDDDRAMATRLLLAKHQPTSCVIFCNFKKDAKELANVLLSHGYSVAALHGDLEQHERDQTLLRFTNKSISVLVATDVAARGLDIDSLDAVINYQLSRDGEVHVHRIGRTGRAGSKGIACSLVAPNEGYQLGLIEDSLDRDIVKKPLPDMDLLQKPVLKAEMITLRIEAGKKQKIRAGDILGALTKDGKLDGQAIGKIKLEPNCSYVAVNAKLAKKAFNVLADGKLKGRSVRVRLIK